MKKDRQSARGEVPLAERTCGACRDAKAPLPSERIAGLLWQLEGWECVGGRRLRKRWRFEDFAQALAFVVRVGALAEEAGHHPEILLGWGFVRVETWTHRVGGLTEADFVLAARIDRLS